MKDLVDALCSSEANVVGEGVKAGEFDVELDEAGDVLFDMLGCQMVNTLLGSDTVIKFSTVRCLWCRANLA